MLGRPKAEINQRVKEALALVDLDGFADRFVDQISGGQQQRVALARALILKPKVLLFDEPLSNLDANLRRSMREKIRELQQQFNITSLYVTHDQSEAFAVSDMVLVMNKGKIMQLGAPQELYRQPASHFMASFMGMPTSSRRRSPMTAWLFTAINCRARQASPTARANARSACARKPSPSACKARKASAAPLPRSPIWGRNTKCRWSGTDNPCYCRSTPPSSSRIRG